MPFALATCSSLVRNAVLAATPPARTRVVCVGALLFKFGNRAPGALANHVGDGGLKAGGPVENVLFEQGTGRQRIDGALDRCFEAGI